MNKVQLEILINLPKRHFDAVIKLINPKITDKDLKPILPDNWSNNNWLEFKYDYDSFRKTQIQIDEWNEKLMGC